MYVAICSYVSICTFASICCNCFVKPGWLHPQTGMHFVYWNNYHTNDGVCAYMCTYEWLIIDYSCEMNP